MDFYVPLFLILPFLLLRNSSDSGNSSSTKASSDFSDVAKIENIEFAQGSPNPAWPLISKKKKIVSYKKTDGKYVGTTGYSFGRPRSGGARIHVGMDLWALPEDPVVAMEDGEIVGIQGFLGPTKAMLVQGKSGLVVLYGEIKDGSWKEFGLKKGSFVKKGDKIARVGKNDAGGAMLHLETYKEGTTKNITLSKGAEPDPRILNPTKYLLLAQKNLNS